MFGNELFHDIAIELDIGKKGEFVYGEISVKLLEPHWIKDSSRDVQLLFEPVHLNVEYTSYDYAK